MGQLLGTDGKPVGKGDVGSEPKRVLEYMVFENKMFYPDGWIIRGEMFEGVRGRFSDLN